MILIIIICSYRNTHRFSSNFQIKSLKNTSEIISDAFWAINSILMAFPLFDILGKTIIKKKENLNKKKAFLWSKKIKYIKKILNHFFFEWQAEMEIIEK